MTPKTFLSLLTVAVAFFAVGLPVMQTLVLRELRRRGRHPDRREACGVRDHVLRSVLHAALPGGLLLAATFVLWLAAFRPPPGWSWALGAEILLAFLVLQMGLSVFTVRFVIQAAAQERLSRAALVRVRLAVLAGGWLYALAVRILVPGGPGETLFAVLVLGVGTGILGLNRTAAVSPGVLARLSDL